MRIWMLMMLGATLTFGQTSPPDTLQKCQKILDDATHDRNPDVRMSGAEALSLVGANDNVLKSLAPMLDDHDVQVRLAVVATLGDFKDGRTLPLLKKALQDPVPEVDFSAAKVLYQLHDPEGMKFLLDVINKETKASSSYISNQKRTALHMLHTPTKLFIFIGIQAAGMAVPLPGVGFGISSAQGILSASDSSARAASAAADRTIARPRPGGCCGLSFIGQGMVRARCRRPPGGDASLSRDSASSWSLCWTTRRMLCASAPPQPICGPSPPPRGRRQESVAPK